MRNVAGDMLHEHMQRAFGENPRGELYRTLTLQDLWNKLRQNLEEIEVAIRHGNNDIGDKLADAGNYIAFIYRIIMDPLEGADDPVTILVGQMHGLTFTWEKAQEVINLINKHTIGAIDVSGFGEAPYSRVAQAGTSDGVRARARLANVRADVGPPNWDLDDQRKVEGDDRGKKRQAHPAEPD